MFGAFTIRWKAHAHTIDNANSIRPQEKKENAFSPVCRRHEIGAEESQRAETIHNAKTNADSTPGRKVALTAPMMTKSTSTLT